MVSESYKNGQSGREKLSRQEEIDINAIIVQIEDLASKISDVKSIYDLPGDVRDKILKLAWQDLKEKRDKYEQAGKADSVYKVTNIPLKELKGLAKEILEEVIRDNLTSV